MSHARVAILRALLALGGVAAVGCGLADMFSSGGLKDVTITYQGDTTVAPGTTVPFSIVVSVGGAVQAAPRFSATSQDTSVLKVTATMDSLIGVSNGFDTLTIRLVSTIFTDSVPSIRQAIRVRP